MATQERTFTSMPSGFGVEDKQYRLKAKANPLSLILPTRHTHRYSLLWYDEDLKQQRALRYSKNQRTPFEDEQDANAIISPVEFKDGFLSVEKTNPVLQWFLHLHPGNGTIFEQVNKKMEAQEELKFMDLQDKADEIVKSLSEEQQRSVALVIFSNKSTKWTKEEIYVQLRRYAKTKPKEIIKIADDPELETTSTVSQFLSKKLIVVKFGTQVLFNLPDNKNKMCELPKKSDASKEELLSEYFKTEIGMEHYAYLENMLQSRS
jgi:hypothetical protein